MLNTTSKEKILKKIRSALMHKSAQESIGDVDNESEIFVSSEEPLEIQFAQNFSLLDGKFVFCENESEFIENIHFIAKDNEWKDLFCLEPKIKELLQKAKINFSDQEKDFLNTNISLTLCENLVARTGSIIITSKQASGRRLPIYGNTHIVIAYTSQIVPHVKDALKNIRDKYDKNLPSMISTITGPSTTADIEKTLVKGAHGPKDVFVFLIDDVQ